jgi:hypothetical protein
MLIDEDKEPNIDEIRKKASLEIAKYGRKLYLLPKDIYAEMLRVKLIICKGEALIIRLHYWEQHYRLKKFRSGQILMDFTTMIRDMFRIQSL